MINQINRRTESILLCKQLFDKIMQVDENAIDLYDRQDYKNTWRQIIILTVWNSRNQKKLFPLFVCERNVFFSVGQFDKNWRRFIFVVVQVVE